MKLVNKETLGAVQERVHRLEISVNLKPLPAVVLHRDTDFNPLLLDGSYLAPHVNSDGQKAHKNRVLTQLGFTGDPQAECELDLKCIRAQETGRHCRPIVGTIIVIPSHRVGLE